MKKDKEEYFFDRAYCFSDSKKAKLLNETRMKIINMISEKALFTSQIAKKLGINEQKVYYHIKPLIEENLIEITEKKEIRGTVARKLKAVSRNIICAEKPAWKTFSKGYETEKGARELFFQPFMQDSFSGSIVVGSPDPHGPHKARARDGHYAIDFALFLGNLVSLSHDFSVFLDVDTSLKDAERNMILVGGPVTNLLTCQINAQLPVFFSQKENWALKGKKLYTEDNIGLIARIQNPFKPQFWIIVLAGIRFTGTKAAVIGITRHTELVLSRFSGQKRFCAVVEGFDLDADGRIDHIELLQ
jgi:DNA-binding transcriptional ArsR family regulator